MNMCCPNLKVCFPLSKIHMCTWGRLCVCRQIHFLVYNIRTASQYVLLFLITIKIYEILLKAVAARCLIWNIDPKK